MTPCQEKRRSFSHDQRVLFYALLTGLPGSLIALSMLWAGDYTPKVQWTLSVLILCFWFGFALAVRRKVSFPLQTVSNLLAALREGDYSIRAKGASIEDPLGQVVLEVNALGETLRAQRLDALDATTLLRKVMEEIDVAVFTLDNDERLRLVNRAGEKLLAQPAERLLGRSASELGLDRCLRGSSPRTERMAFPGRIGHWGIRRTDFREHGLPHKLLVVTDLSQALREEERQAWKRLIRVLGHELNNSLAPIKSMVGTLEGFLKTPTRGDDWEEDMRRGLSVIGTRAESLRRFMSDYSRLARLPEPEFESVEVGRLIRRVVGLESRLRVELEQGPTLTIQADAGQLEQALINLLRNAVDAALETSGGVRVGWSRSGSTLDVWVEDEGPGIPSSANLFVPFFTTKPGGSGIGLVLTRQIAEAHSGSLTLENRSDGRGCEARLRLPLREAVKKKGGQSTLSPFFGPDRVSP